MFEEEDVSAGCTCSEPYTYMTSEDHVHRGDFTSVFASFYQRTTVHGVENLGKAKGKSVDRLIYVRFKCNVMCKVIFYIYILTCLELKLLQNTDSS